MSYNMCKYSHMYTYSNIYMCILKHTHTYVRIIHIIYIQYLAIPNSVNIHSFSCDPHIQLRVVSNPSLDHVCNVLESGSIVLHLVVAKSNVVGKFYGGWRQHQGQLVTTHSVEEWLVLTCLESQHLHGGCEFSQSFTVPLLLTCKSH